MSGLSPASLFDTPPESVAQSGSNWLLGLLSGTLPVMLCVIAVAFVGMAMLTGRLSPRYALRVAIGCFVLLGAPTIAAGLLGVAGDPAAAVATYDSPGYSPPPPAALPPANYDPYAGASLRRD